MKWMLSLVVLLTACSSPEESAVPGDRPDATDFADADAAVDLGLPDQDAADQTTAPEASVFERGPYNVGHRRFDITYDAELEPGRTIKLSVWYPTHDVTGRPGLYVINLQRPEVFRDASVAIDGRAPLLVFSHGNGSLAEQSYFMTEFWASHGWVVVAPYHTGNTVFNVGDGGGLSLESAPVRPQDISAALDAVYGLQAPDPLAGKISDDVVLSGHSFGGFTTLAVAGADFAVDAFVAACAVPNRPSECQMLDREGVEEVFRAGFLDERIDVAIPQAPGGFFAFQAGISTIAIPTLLMTAARDVTLPPDGEGEPIWNALTGPHMRVDLRAGGHFTFSNMCELLPVEQVLNDGCSESFIAPQTAFELVNAYSLAFAQYMLWGDTRHEALLRGDDDRYQAHVKLSWKPEAGLN